ncbi:MAG TPA: hypothetical protein PKY30_20440, partial [Myxococcota bacterium]|nr:hypothetical protein [Myxococcota bacterium]
MISPDVRERGGFGYDFGGLPDLTGDGVGEVYATQIKTYVYDGKSLALLYSIGDPCTYGHLQSAGDLTGDGAGDLVVSSIGNAEAGANAGKVYLIPGPLPPGSHSLAGVFTTAWRGENASDYAGINVGPAGDLTGDGQSDLLIGASGFDGADGGGGRLYVVAGPFTEGTFSLANAYASVTGLGLPPAGPPPPHGSYGVGDFVGDAQAGAVDLDGDGVQDLALGGHGDRTVGLNAGKVAIFFGPLPGGAVSITDADITLFGEAEESYTGSPLRGSADLTGDGLDDIIASADTLGAGVVYILSPRMGQTSVSEAYGRLEGEEAGDLFGYALSSTVDLDGDGSLDLGISAPASARKDGVSGAFWWFSGPFSPGVTSSATGHLFESTAISESFGSALDVAGDL